MSENIWKIVKLELGISRTMAEKIHCVIISFCEERVFVSPQDSYVEIITSHVMLFGGGGLGSDLVMRMGPS
jgi:hypothetical protein